MRAAIYARVSTEEQARDGLSLGAQQDRTNALITRENWTLVETYVDAGVSGRRDDRPELTRLLANLTDIDRVVVTSLDRLGRNTRHLLEVSERFLAAGVQLVSIRENLDTGTPSGRMFFTMTAAMATMESELIGERTAIGQRERARTGKPHGRSSYGFRRDGDYLRSVPDEAAVVRRIFDEYRSGVALTAIARGLDADGIRPMRGAHWGRTSVAKVVDNVHYIGRVRFSGEEHPSEFVDRIVDDATWQEVRARRDAVTASAGKGRGRPIVGRHLFGGEMPLMCTCGERLEPRTDLRKDGTRYEAYRCPGRRRHTCDLPVVPRSEIDVEAVRYFLRVGLDVDATRDAIAEKVSRDVADARALRRSAETAFQQAEERLLRVRRDYQDGRLDADDWREQRDELTEGRDAARSEAERMKTREGEVRSWGASLDAEEATLRHLADLRRQVVGRVREWGVQSASGNRIVTGRSEPDADDVRAIRAAMSQVYGAFHLHFDPDGEIAEEDVSAYAGSLGEWILNPALRGDVTEEIRVALHPILQATPEKTMVTSAAACDLFCAPIPVWPNGPQRTGVETRRGRDVTRPRADVVPSPRAREEAEEG